MSTTSIEAHHQKWADLPEFPQWPYVITDDDIAFWSDILNMRTLVDDIERLAGEQEFSEVPAAGSVEFEVDQYLEPWPRDIAGDLIAVWRAIKGDCVLAITAAVAS